MARVNGMVFEADLNKAVVKYINSLPGCYAEKRMAGMGRKGKVDITGTILGIRLEIEGKVEKKGDNNPSPSQKKHLNHWRDHGAIAFAFWNIEEARYLVDLAVEMVKVNMKNPVMIYDMPVDLENFRLIKLKRAA